MILLFTVLMLTGITVSAQELQPFFEVGRFDKTIPELTRQIQTTLTNASYEIIFQGNMATSLAGKYRIALYWPEPGMGTFMKIIKTPGAHRRYHERTYLNLSGFQFSAATMCKNLNLALNFSP